MGSLRLEARNLRKRYGQRVALDVAELILAPGEIVNIMGPSGAGKTTLLRMLALLLAPDAGELQVDGQPARAHDPILLQRLGWVGQKPVVFRLSAFDNVAFGLRARGLPEVDVRPRVEAEMRNLGVWHLRDEPARTLSGGEQQRLAFARAAVREPELLVLDEFTANLDESNSRILEARVAHMAASGATIVASTHDDRVAQRLGSRVVWLEQGRIVREELGLVRNRDPARLPARP